MASQADHPVAEDALDFMEETSTDSQRIVEAYLKTYGIGLVSGGVCQARNWPAVANRTATTPGSLAC